MKEEFWIFGFISNNRTNSNLDKTVDSGNKSGIESHAEEHSGTQLQLGRDMME
jgi:hypothetical protein